MNILPQKRKPLIFSFERCGSTSFLKIMRTFLEKDLWHEPFNIKSPYAIQDSLGFEQRLLRTGDESPGFKHVEGICTEEQNQKILKELDGSYSVVFLYRRNLYARVLSYFISLNSKEWSVRRENILQTSFKPINIKDMVVYLERNKKKFSSYKEFFKKQKIPVIYIAYEDIFGKSITQSKRKWIFFRVLYKNLGMGIFSKRNRERIEELQTMIEWSSPKINTHETYNLIPNIKEIDDYFKGDFGSIFDE